MPDPHFRLSDQAQSAQSASRMPGFLSKTLAVATAAVLAVIGFMFTLTALAVAVVVVAIGGGYLWWKTRHIRKQMREGTFDPQAFHAEARTRAYARSQTPDDVIEGEVIREVSPQEGSRHTTHS